MMPHRRPRTGFRRDGLVRTIRTDEVRYPGFTHPALEEQQLDEWRRSGRSLMPARDTGFAVEGRLARERRRRQRERRQRTIAAAAVLVLLVALGVGWRSASDLKAAEQSAAGSGSPATRRSAAADPSVGQLRALYTQPAPTPIIATRGRLQMRLPVRLADLTELGFHQASYSYALHMDTPMPLADMSAVKKAKSSHRDLAKQATGDSAVLTGHALVMWRSRPGKPDTAVDVGAAPGSDVLAPVTGTVVKVKKYKLYGKYTDYEIHIRPEGFPGIDCVMIHIEGVAVRPGDTVTAGVTKVGAVRKLSDREALQLGHYTKDGGDHTHIQLNDATDPDYEGLEGALSIAGS